MAGAVLIFPCWLLGRQAARPGVVEPPHPHVARVEAGIRRPTPSDGEGIHALNEPLAGQRWQDAVRDCIGEPSWTRRLTSFYEMTQRLEVRDFPALMEVLRGQKTDLGLSAELFEIWAERDLKSARVWFDAQPKEDHSWLGIHLVAVWGRMDPAGLANWISTLPPEDRRSLAPPHDITWRELIGVIAERDPEATLDLLSKIPEVDRYDQAIAIEALLRRDPAAAAVRTLAMPTGEAKNAAFNALAFGWMKKDPAAALDWFGQLDDPEKVTWARSIAALESAKGNEAEFLKALESVPSDERFPVLETRASMLARTAPDQAIAFARSQTDPVAREAMMITVLREISTVDPARAVELWLAETTPSGGAGNSVAKNIRLDGGTMISALVAKQGVTAALRFLDRVPSDQAASLKNLPMLVAQVAGWAAVADAAAQMPAGTRRSEWLQQSVSALARDGELSAAQRFIARLSAGPDRENAIKAMGGALFSENPDVGATTLLQLPDGSNALAEEVQRWIKADAPEARRWISRTTLLHEELKSELLNPAADSP